MVGTRVKRKLVGAVEGAGAEPEIVRTCGWKDGASGHEHRRMSGGLLLRCPPILFHALAPAPSLSPSPSPFHGTGAVCSDGGTAVQCNAGDDEKKRKRRMTKRQMTGNWADHVIVEYQNPDLRPARAHGSRGIQTPLG